LTTSVDPLGQGLTWPITRPDESGLPADHAGHVLLLVESLKLVAQYLLTRMKDSAQGANNFLSWDKSM
jgi:hypothetical protein